MAAVLMLAALFVPQFALAQEDPPDSPDEYDYRGTDFANVLSWTITQEAGEEGYTVTLNVKGIATELGIEYAPEDLAAITDGVCMWVEVEEGTWECVITIDILTHAPAPVFWNPETGEWDWDGPVPADWPEDWPPNFPPSDDPGWVTDPSLLPPCEEGDPNCEWSDEMLDPSSYYPGQWDDAQTPPIPDGWLP